MTIDGNRMIMSAIGKLFGLYMAVSVEFQMYAADRQMGGRQEWTWITESGNGLNRGLRNPVTDLTVRLCCGRRWTAGRI